jgi:hypothetical protein
MTDRNHTNDETEVIEGASVEVVDLHDNTTTPTDDDADAIKTVNWPQMRHFDRVEILPNGWAKCIGGDHVDGVEEGEVAVDYYPPERINQIGTIVQEGRNGSQPGGSS